MKRSQQTPKQTEDEAEKADLKDDLGNVAILLSLYLLQGENCEKYFNFADFSIALGIPIGISYAIPILLQNRGVSYAEQAGFTFAFYPFTSK